MIFFFAFSLFVVCLIYSLLPIDTLPPSRTELIDGRKLNYNSNTILDQKVQAVDEENILEPSSAGSDALLETIRIARAINNLNNNQNNQVNTDETANTKDQETAAAENASSSLDELTLDSIEDDENRDKRFVIMIDLRKLLNQKSLINYESKQIFDRRLWCIFRQWTSKRWWFRRIWKFLV